MTNGEGDFARQGGGDQNGIAAPPNREHAKAQFNLGVMYDKGEGVLQDKAEAGKMVSPRR